MTLDIESGTGLFRDKTVLLLDMNSTFMFGEDRFGQNEDYSLRYRCLGGALPNSDINRIVRDAYCYLDARYPDERYRHAFPSLETAIREVAGAALEARELVKVVDAFAWHEIGHIPETYARVLHALAECFTLAAVIDIWSPKRLWLREFERAGISELFSAMSFSSDHGIVKPSPRPFERLLDQLGVVPSEALVVGDSVRRDLGGARRAGIDCVLVGGAQHPDALGSFRNLIELSKVLRRVGRSAREPAFPPRQRG